MKQNKILFWKTIRDGLILGMFSLCILMMTINCKNVYASSNDISVVFTSDLHSHVSTFKTRINGGSEINVGGFARLKTYIDSKRNEDNDLLLVDTGDLISGTLYQTLVDSEAVELSMLCEMGYDAVTIGNHEFDFGLEALSNMYSIVNSKYDVTPQLISCNLKLNPVPNGLNQYGIKDYTIVEKNGVKIAIIGVMGQNAVNCIIDDEIQFSEYIESVKETVEKVKLSEKPDMIVCLSHSGTGEKLGKTEDERLAKKVPDIDLIISGHTHTLLQNYASVGDTAIVSCGEYGIYTGFVKLTRKSNGRWFISKYETKLMDESIEEDEEIAAQISDKIRLIDENVLAQYGMQYDEVLANNPNIIFENRDEYYSRHSEIKLGDLLSDAYRYSAGRYGNTDTPVDIAIVPNGTIRNSICTGKITVNDAFSVLSMGGIAGDKLGYPLVEAYLTGKEIRSLAEIDTTFSEKNGDYMLHTSGLSFEYNPNRLYLDKVSDMWMSSALLEDSVSAFEKEKLYHIVTDYYTLSVLSRIGEVTNGLLNAKIKDSNGNEVTALDDCIIYDEAGKELKSFMALALYLKSFKAGSNGISVIPEYYASYHSRKVVNDSYSPVALLKNTNGKIYAIVIVILVVIVIIIVVARMIKKKKNKKKALYY